MARDDYFVILYEIMKYLYNCLKQGKDAEVDQLTAEYFEIPERYWKYIMYNLINDGYVTGVFARKTKFGIAIIDLDSIQITPQGIQYYFDNNFLQKVKKSLTDPDKIIGLMK
mgnify:FL=1